MVEEDGEEGFRSKFRKGGTGGMKVKREGREGGNGRGEVGRMVDRERGRNRHTKCRRRLAYTAEVKAGKRRGEEEENVIGESRVDRKRETGCERE